MVGTARFQLLIQSLNLTNLVKLPVLFLAMLFSLQIVGGMVVASCRFVSRAESIKAVIYGRSASMVPPEGGITGCEFGGFSATDPFFRFTIVVKRENDVRGKTVNRARSTIFISPALQHAPLCFTRARARRLAGRGPGGGKGKGISSRQKLARPSRRSTLISTRRRASRR